MRRLCFALACLATPALAETDVRQAVIDVANASGCVITDAVAEASFPAMGLTKELVGPVVEAMITAGEGELVDNEFHLSAALCTAAAATTPPVPAVSPLMARVIEVFQANGCTMDEATGMPALEASGLTEDDMNSLTDESDALVAAGFMSHDDATGAVTVLEPLCSEAATGEEPSQPLIDMLTDNGCALSPDAAAPLLESYGLTMDAADQMADDLMNRGLAQIDGENLVLLNCGD